MPIITSSSSSSSDSSSSSSSLSLSSSSSSSSSSYSSSSSSSYSSYSSSSSSSIDSSSSSSETVDFAKWNQIKPVIMAQSAIDSSVVKNRLAQTIKLKDSYYDIKKVYVYLYGPYGVVSSLNFHMDIYSATDDGKPYQLKASSQISGSAVTKNGWYGFDFNLSDIAPSNGFLSFVFWQDGGDESNYALLGYINGSKDGATAWFSNDGLEWNIHSSLIGSLTSNIVMALNVGDSFNILDLVDYRIVSTGAQRKNLVQNTYDAFENGEFRNTKLERGESVYGYVDNGAKVVIDLPSMLVSFVIDSSGSMGWNDRFGDRITMVRNFIDRFIVNYPAKVLFDFISSGSQIVNSQSGISNAGYTATGNLDWNNPIRRNYLFSLSSTIVSVSQGAVYEAPNGTQFTVMRNTSSNESVLLCNGKIDPTSSGVLTKVSGTGDLQINYTSFLKASFDTQIVLGNVVAFGFKNLEENHAYNIGDIVSDTVTIVSAASTRTVGASVIPRNWQDVSDDWQDVVFIAGNNGSRSTASVDFTAVNIVSIVRNALSDRALQTVPLTSAVNEGDSVINLGTHTFSNGDLIDVVDGYLGALGYVVQSFTANTLTVAPPVSRAISKNGIVQESNSQNAKALSGNTTLKLLLRDLNVSKNVTFFAQLTNGLSMEWDLKAFDKWYAYNLFYYDETANINLTAFDINGSPIVDGTPVDFFVDNLPTAITNKRNEILDHKLVQNAMIGESSIFLDSINGYVSGLKLDIMDDQNNLQTVDILTVDSIGKVITIGSSILFDFTVTNKSRTVLSVTTKNLETTESGLLGMTVSSVDMTPVLTGRNLNSDLLDLSDPIPLSPLATYASVNSDRSVIQNNINQVPSIEGKALIRVLPITEDPIKKIIDKSIEENRFDISESNPFFVNQIEQNQGDEAISRQQIEIASVTTVVQPVLVSEGQIDSTVILNGSASSAFSTQSKDFEEISGSILKYVNDVDNYVKNSDPTAADVPSQPVFAKPYEVFPLIRKDNPNNVALYRYLFNPAQMYIASPIFMYSTVSEQVVFKDCFCGFSSQKQIQYSDITVNGTYADGAPININYIVSSKGVLIRSGSLRVRIYVTTVLNLRDNASWGNGYNGQKYACSGPPSATVKFNTPFRTDINIFRSEAASNTSPTEALGDIRYEIPLQYIGQEWQIASSLGTISDTTVPITNGYASIIIPSVSEPCLLMVETSVYFGTNNEYESIRREPIFILNPISIGRIAPQSIIAKEDDTFGEVSSAISFKGLPMIDNVVVDFINTSRFMADLPRSSTQTAIKPVSSKTVNGSAAGVFIGHHDAVLMKSIDGNLVGEFESVNMTVSFLGFTESADHIFQWIGLNTEPQDASLLDDYFKVGDGSVGYSDGQNGSIISIDLNDPDTILHAGTAIPFLKGQDQLGGLPAPISIIPDGEDVIVTAILGGGRWTSDGKASFIVNMNKNIGNEQPICSSDSHPSNYPWKINLKISSTYREYSTDEQRWLTKTISGYYLFNVGYGLQLSNPQAILHDPLKIELSLESRNSNFLRDGSDSPIVVADITWRDQFITEEFVSNEGGEAERSVFINFPNVSFEAGICSKENSITISGCEQILDIHNTLNGCAIIETHPDVSLTSFTATVGLLRTTKYTDANGSHVHSTEVNSIGVGQTTSVISLSGNVPDHIHSISNFIVISVAGHSHVLRSVALTQLIPTTNNVIDVVINGSIGYNPTSVPNGRTMIGTFLSLGISDKKLTIKLSTAPKLLSGDMPRFTITSGAVNAVNSTRYMVASTTSDVDKGFDILANVYFTSDNYGDQMVPDGTRVIFDIKSYGVNTDFVFVDENNLRDVYIMEITATVTSDNQTVSETAYVVMSSFINWIPSSSSLVADFTNDELDIETALSRVISVGSSPIHDSVKNAADRLSQYAKITSPDIKWGKIIFLLTDLDENLSEFSIEDAINRANYIDGNKSVPVVPVKFGFSYGSDDVLSDKYALSTGGIVRIVDNLSSSTEVNSIIDELILDKNISNFNKGTYRNTIVLPESSIVDNISVGTVISDDSDIIFRVRFSDDNIHWSVFSEFTSYLNILNFALNMSNKGIYIQYETDLFGSKNFISPQLRSLSMDYYEPNHSVVFFQPTDLDITDDDYVSSVCIAHEGKVPNVSVVNYGFSHIDSSDINDYYSVTQPLINPYVQSVILSRYNEPLLSMDRINYVAINGGWPSQATIQIYRINSSFPEGQLVDSSEYGVNHKSGTITFDSLKDKGDQFLLTISFDLFFRIICNMINYGPVGAIVDSINILYNTTQRIIRDKNGNIIRAILK